MSNSLIQTEMSELVIGLSSEHTYREITPTHTHSRAQFLYASTGMIQVFTPNHVWIVPPMCALWIPTHVEHSVISLSRVKLNTALVQQMHIAHALSKIASGESVAQIARSLGYSNPSAFSSMFKRHLGQTPQQFKYKDE